MLEDLIGTIIIVVFAIGMIWYLMKEFEIFAIIKKIMKRIR